MIFGVVIYRFWKLKGHVIGWAKAYASIQGERSGEARREKADAKLVASGRQKIVDTIASNVPGAGTMLKASGVTDGEAFAMFTDPATLKGLKVLADFAGSIGKFVAGAGEKKPRGRRQKGGAPLIEYKATDR